MQKTSFLGFHVLHEFRAGEETEKKKEVDKQSYQEQVMSFNDRKLKDSSPILLLSSTNNR